MSAVEGWMVLVACLCCSLQDCVQFRCRHHTLTVKTLEGAVLNLMVRQREGVRWGDCEGVRTYVGVSVRV